MGLVTLESPRLRGLLYLLGFIASTTTFGHASELCGLHDRCTGRERTVIAFSVFSAFFALLLFVGAGLERRVLRVSELALGILLASFTMVAAVVVTLLDTLRDLSGVGLDGLPVSEDDTSIPLGFAWFAQFLATAGLYHFLVFGYGTVAEVVKTAKKVDDGENGEKKEETKEETKGKVVDENAA